MTIANFKKMVAAYLNRTVASFTVDSQDILLQALNDARRAAQLDHNFELNRTEDAYLSTHFGGTNWMTAAKTVPGGATACLMKRVDEVWNYTSYAVGATTYYPRTTRVPFDYTGRFARELPPVDRVLVVQQQQAFTTQDQFAYVVGTQLFVTTITTATIFKLLGIKWLDDFVGTEDPDIFLTYFTEWTKFATVQALNVYLKDSERFPIDERAVSKAWERVKTMDGTIANMGESVNLD